MSLYDDLLVNDDYDRGLKDGEKMYREKVIANFSNFVDSILDDELNKTFPNINYEFSLLVRENQKYDKVLSVMEKIIEEKDEMIVFLEERLDECKDVLIEAKDEIIRLQGEKTNG